MRSSDGGGGGGHEEEPFEGVEDDAPRSPTDPSFDILDPVCFQAECFPYYRYETQQKQKQQRRRGDQGEADSEESSASTTTFVLRQQILAQKRAADPFPPPPPEHRLPYRWSLATKAAFETIMKTVQPAPWIAELVERVTPSEPFVCLHPRIEADFQFAFAGDRGAYRSWSDIHAALRRYFRSPAWQQLNETVPGGVQTLYLAGGVDPSLVVELVTKDSFFAAVTSKHRVLQSLSSSDERRRASRGAPQTILDSFVCQRSVLHIGTRSSVWDEWVHGVRRLHDPPLPSLSYTTTSTTTIHTIVNVSKPSSTTTPAAVAAADSVTAVESESSSSSLLVPFVGRYDHRWFLTEEERTQLREWWGEGERRG